MSGYKKYDTFCSKTPFTIVHHVRGISLFSFYWQRVSGHNQDKSKQVDLFCIFKMLCSTVSTNQKGKGVAVKEAAQDKSRSTGNKISEL